MTPPFCSDVIYGSPQSSFRPIRWRNRSPRGRGRSSRRGVVIGTGRERGRRDRQDSTPVKPDLRTDDGAEERCAVRCPPTQLTILSPSTKYQHGAAQARLPQYMTFARRGGEKYPKFTDGKYMMGVNNREKMYRFCGQRAEESINFVHVLRKHFVDVIHGFPQRRPYDDRPRCIRASITNAIASIGWTEMVRVVNGRGRTARAA